MERDDWLRVAWKVMVAGKSDARRLVFVDEMGTNISLCPLYGWASKGERARWSVPRNRGPNTTLLVSMSVEGMRACPAMLGATTAAVFEAYVEKVLVPSLRRGQIVVMDNLSAHKGGRGRGAHRRAGLQAALPAALLTTGLQPHRGGFQQD